MEGMLLLGSDPRACDMRGNSALHLAAAAGHEAGRHTLEEWAAPLAPAVAGVDSVCVLLRAVVHRDAVARREETLLLLLEHSEDDAPLVLVDGWRALGPGPTAAAPRRRWLRRLHASCGQPPPLGDDDDDDDGVDDAEDVDSAS